MDVLDIYNGNWTCLILWMRRFGMELMVLGCKARSVTWWDERGTHLGRRRSRLAEYAYWSLVQDFRTMKWDLLYMIKNSGPMHAVDTCPAPWVEQNNVFFCWSGYSCIHWWKVRLLCAFDTRLPIYRFGFFAKICYKGWQGKKGKQILEPDTGNFYVVNMQMGSYFSGPSLNQEIQYEQWYLSRYSLAHK